MERFKIRKMTEGDGYVTIWQVSGDIEPKDINDAVYAAMCEVGQDVLSQSVCRLSGEHTAVELAGRVMEDLPSFKVAVGIPVFDIPETMAPEVRINVGMITVGYKQQAPMFTCSFAAADVFAQIAEWEGQMNMAPKKYRKFACVSVDGRKYESKPYVRHHGYHPTVISYKADQDRINKKFETLGKLCQRLTSEGMRKAYSVVCAAHKWDGADFDTRDMAKWAMLWKLQRDYGREPEAQPLYFVGSDFKYGPEIWKEADVSYGGILIRHFEQMLLDAPKPEWPARGDVVTIRESAQTKKKHEGKHLVDSVSPRLSADGRRIEWTVAVSVGRYDCERFLPEQLEAADNKKVKTKAAKKTTTKTTKATGKAKPKASKAAPTQEPKTETLSLEERLRQALRARLAA